MDLLIILSINGFIRTLFVLVLIFYGIRIFARYVLPLLVDKGIKNMQQKMQDQQHQNQRSTRQPGDVTIEYNNRSNKSNSQNKGDYVDFEEVD